MFYDLKEVKTKALKFYESPNFFISFLEEREIFPFTVKFKKIKQSDLIQNFSQISKEIEIVKKSNLPFVFESRNYKNIGIQNLPNAVEYKSREAFLKFINRELEFTQFIRDYEKIVLQYPTLKMLFMIKPKLIIEYTKDWDKLLSICDYFRAKKHINNYIRELSIVDVNTKFIEKHKSILDKLLSNILDENSFDSSITGFKDYGFERKYLLKYPLPLVRFRILDEKLKLSGVSDITLPINEFEALKIDCKTVFVVENKITTLSFPQVKNAIVLFGSGYSVGILKNVEWFRSKKIYYWGDIDRDGFAILSQVRGYFSHVKSIMMDKKSIINFKNLSVTDSKTGLYPKTLQHLTQDEEEIYQQVYETEFRLEQERIDFSYVKEILQQL
jgi:hypothetical protein